MLGALGVLAVEMHAQHLHIEMGAGQNRGAAIRRLDRVDVSSDIPEYRMGHLVGQLNRRAGGSRGPHRSKQNDNGDRDNRKIPARPGKRPLLEPLLLSVMVSPPPMAGDPGIQPTGSIKDSDLGALVQRKYCDSRCSGKSDDVGRVNSISAGSRRRVRCSIACRLEKLCCRIFGVRRFGLTVGVAKLAVARSGGERRAGSARGGGLIAHILAISFCRSNSWRRCSTSAADRRSMFE